MSGIYGVIDLLAQTLRYPMFGGWLSPMMLINGFVIIWLVITVTISFTKRLGQ